MMQKKKTSVMLWYFFSLTCHFYIATSRCPVRVKHIHILDESVSNSKLTAPLQLSLRNAWANLSTTYPGSSFGLYHVVDKGCGTCLEMVQALTTDDAEVQSAIDGMNVTFQPATYTYGGSMIEALWFVPDDPLALWNLDDDNPEYADIPVKKMISLGTDDGAQFYNDGSTCPKKAGSSAPPGYESDPSYSPLDYDKCTASGYPDPADVHDRLVRNDIDLIVFVNTGHISSCFGKGGQSTKDWWAYLGPDQIGMSSTYSVGTYDDEAQLYKYLPSGSDCESPTEPPLPKYC